MDSTFSIGSNILKDSKVSTTIKRGQEFGIVNYLKDYSKFIEDKGKEIEYYKKFVPLSFKDDLDFKWKVSGYIHCKFCIQLSFNECIIFIKDRIRLINSEDTIVLSSILKINGLYNAINSVKYLSKDYIQNNFIYNIKLKNSIRHLDVNVDSNKEYLICFNLKNLELLNYKYNDSIDKYCIYLNNNNLDSRYSYLPDNIEDRIYFISTLVSMYESNKDYLELYKSLSREFIIKFKLKEEIVEKFYIDFNHYLCKNLNCLKSDIIKSLSNFLYDSEIILFYLWSNIIVLKVPNKIHEYKVYSSINSCLGHIVPGIITSYSISSFLNECLYGKSTKVVCNEMNLKKLEFNYLIHNMSNR